MLEQLPYPEIRALMAKYGVTKKIVAGIIGASRQTVASKLNNQSEFYFTEMLKLRAYFINLGANPAEVTIDRLFFEWNPYYSKEA